MVQVTGSFWTQPTVAFTILSTALYLVFCTNPARLYKRRRRWLLRNKKRGSKKSNLNIGGIFGMDVGGTLTKIVYFQANNSPSELPPTRHKSSENLAHLESPDHQAALEEIYTAMDPHTGALSDTDVTYDVPLTIHSDFLGGSLRFLHFETKDMIHAINLLSSTAFMEHIKTIGCTGGGAHKYDKQIKDELEIDIHKYDELGCLVRGMFFALTNFPDELFTYRKVKEEDMTEEEKAQMKVKAAAKNDGEEDVPIEIKCWQQDSKEFYKKVMLPFPTQSAFPHLIVNIGSGVSILKVSGPGQFERVSGTSLGGGTYWGLCRLLTRCKTYEEVLDLAETGDAGKVDMLVKDIYGGDYGGMLLGAMVASSFGKIVMKENPMEGVREEDLALALLMMIANNIGQVVHLNAVLHNCNKIFFVGSFLRHNAVAGRRLAFAIDFWSGGSMEALFLTHEGYLGALGTFLHSAFGAELDKILFDFDKCHPIESNCPNFAAESLSTKLDIDGENESYTYNAQEEEENDAAEEAKKLTPLRRISKNFAEWSKSFSSTVKKAKRKEKREEIAFEDKAQPTTRKNRGRSSSDDYAYRSLIKDLGKD